MTDALSALDAVAEVGDVGGLDDAGRLQLDRGRALVEQPRAAAEQDWGQVEGELVEQARGQVLLDRLRPAGEGDVLAAGGLAGQLQRPLDPVGDEQFFIDLLFFHVGLLRWVIVELKIGRFQPEFAGKLNFYVNAVDGELKRPNHGATIGILLCTERNEQVVEYSLSDIGSPIGVATYKIDETELETQLPPELKGQLPEPGQLQANLKRLVDERGEEVEAVLEAEGLPSDSTDGRVETGTLRAAS